MNIHKALSFIFIFSFLIGQNWMKDQMADRQINQAISNYNNGRFAIAQSILKKVLLEENTYHQEPALALLIKSQIALSQSDEAKENSKVFFTKFPMSQYQKNVMESLGDLYVNEANYDSAYRMYFRAKRLNNNKKYNSKINKKLSKLIQVNIPSSSLNELIILELDEESKNIHLLAKANTELLNGNPNKASKTLSAVKPGILPNIFSNIFEDLLRSTFSPPADVLMIGLVLPLSGEQSEYGKAFLEGFSQGQLVSNQDNRQLSVIIQDTKSDDLQAVRIVKNLEKINQISALICPLFDHTSLAVVSALNESDIPIILPNNRKEDLTKIYRNTFLISSTIALEAKLAANFAVNQLKLDSLAVLAPADKYGQIQMDSFIKEVDRLGASIVATQWYSGEPKNLQRQFKYFREIAFNLVEKENTYDDVLGMDIDSLDALFDISTEDFFDLPDPEKKIMSTSDSNKVMLAGIQGFYIPIKVNDLEYVGPQIPMYNFETKIIGNSNWQNLEILTKENIGPHLKGMYLLTNYKIGINDSINFKKEFIYEFYKGYNTSFLLNNINLLNKSRGELNKILSKLDFHKGKGFFYSSSVDNNNINSALQVLKFNGSDFVENGVFINDSLRIVNNHNP